jgi:hypothetical protein
VGGWYHVVVNGSPTLYINGVQAATGSYTWAHIGGTAYIGRRNTTYLNAYLTEFHYIDGSNLTPNSFGFFDNDGVWAPKQYTGPYGTNGFYLTFSDNSDTTATTLGKDYSGNGNNWTPNNFSVAAGAGNDSLVDSPTRYGTDTGAGGEVRGNYATLNPLSGGGTLSNGNLDVAINAAATAYTTFGLPSGKWYWEVLAGGDNGFMGVTNSSLLRVDNTTVNVFAIFDGTSQGTQQSNSTKSFDSYAGFTTNDIIGFALDADNKTCDVYVNNTKVLSFTLFTINGPYFFGIDRSNNTPVPVHVCNFGQRPFAYTAPSGFKALVTTNLPEPTVADGGEYFNTVLYTGTGADRSVTGVGFQPDFVWIKNRGDSSSHGLQDAVRGATKQLRSNSTAAEETLTENVTSFDADGFSLGDNSDGVSVNENTKSYVAWNWKANGAGVSNTDGTITSTVSANTDSGFSIVTAAGQNNTSTLTIGHGLGVAPTMLIGKSRNGTGGWSVWHNALATNELVYLDSTAAKSVDGGTPPAAFTATSSTTFTVQNWNRMIGNGVDGVFYAFAPVAGYSAFGSYTGNGSADGPFVFTGFRPRWILFKRTDGTSVWELVDTARSTYNVVGNVLFPNTNGAESSSGDFGNLCDILSNGFKLRSTSTASNTGTTIYACFAENPFKLALAR